jgi:hypothetical protein
MNDCLKSCSSPSVTRQNISIERFAENASRAHDAVAPEPARLDHKRDALAANGKVRGTTQIPALYALTGSRTVRAKRHRASRAQQYLEMLSNGMNRYDRKTLRCKVRALKSTMHG